MSRAARALVAGAAVAAAIACGGGEQKTPPPDPAAEASGARAWSPDKAGVKEPPDPALFARVARGDLALTDLVDPFRGLIYVAVFEDVRGDHPQAGEDGMVRAAERLCDRRIREIGSLLEERLRSGEGGPPLTCSGLACEKPARAEYDLDTTFVFAAEGGRYVLDRVIQIEGGPVTEAFQAQARAWADGEIERLSGGRCIER